MIPLACFSEDLGSICSFLLLVVEVLELGEVLSGVLAEVLLEVGVEARARVDIEARAEVGVEVKAEVEAEAGALQELVVMVGMEE